MNRNGKALLVVVLLVVFVAVGYLTFNSGNGSGEISSSNQTNSPNFFMGNVTTPGIPVGTYNGTGVYDHNCLPIGNGWYSCDAGIRTSNGIIDFAYKHDMMMKPCIGPGDSLIVKVLDGSGVATVQRLERGSSTYI